MDSGNGLWQWIMAMDSGNVFEYFINLNEKELTLKPSLIPSLINNNKIYYSGWMNELFIHCVLSQ